MCAVLARQKVSGLRPALTRLPPDSYSLLEGMQLSLEVHVQSGCSIEARYCSGRRKTLEAPVSEQLSTSSKGIMVPRPAGNISGEATTSAVKFIMRQCDRS